MLQDVIPGIMSVNVIYGLEVVDIDHQDSDVEPVAPGSQDFPLGEAEKGATVQLCKTVEHGKFLCVKFPWLVINQAEGPEPLAVGIAQRSARKEDNTRCIGQVGIA